MKDVIATLTKMLAEAKEIQGQYELRQSLPIEGRCEGLPPHVISERMNACQDYANLAHQKLNYLATQVLPVQLKADRDMFYSVPGERGRTPIEELERDEMDIIRSRHSIAIVEPVKKVA